MDKRGAAYKHTSKLGYPTFHIDPSEENLRKIEAAFMEQGMEIDLVGSDFYAMSIGNITLIKTTDPGA